MTENPDLDLQVKVSRLVSTGFVFSLVWLAGIGSLIALICGIRALILIKRSKGQIVGKGLAWWCVVLGGGGVLVLPCLVISRLPIIAGP